MSLDERRRGLKSEFWGSPKFWDEEETLKEPERRGKLIRKKTGECSILEVDGMYFKKEGVIK